MSKEEYKDEIKEEKPGGSSRLGKEAKIGVTVIALLLIVFGVVVAVRLRGSERGRQTGCQRPTEEGGREKAGHEGKMEAMFKENRSKPFGGGVPPTVVSAKATSAKPPRTLAGDLDQWKVATDRGEAKRSGGGPSPGTPPPFMPDPPKPPQARAARAVRLGSAGGQRLCFGRSRAGATRVSGALALRASAGATGVVPHGDILLGGRRTFSRLPCRWPNMTGATTVASPQSPSALAADCIIRPRCTIIGRPAATTASTRCSRTTVIGRSPSGFTARGHISRPWPSRTAATAPTKIGSGRAN